MTTFPGAGTDPVPKVRGFVRQTLLSGAVILIPILISIVVLLLVIDLMSGILDPVILVFHRSLGLGEQLPTYLVETVAFLIVLLVMFLLGATAESDYVEAELEDRVAATMASIPGLGSVYTSVYALSDLVLDSDTDSFKEVKLVEFPTAGSYTIAFLTAETPTVVRTATGHEEMVTVFMPMAPNPVMGGHVVHVSTDRVHDVDMTVEEGIQSIVSSGVTVGKRDSLTRSEDGGSPRLTKSTGTETEQTDGKWRADG